MDEAIIKKLDKITSQFTSEDYKEAITLLEEKRKILQQQQRELKEKEAAKILLENVDSLLKNKSHLDPIFVKQIEGLQGNLKPAEVKKRGRKKKNEPDKAS